MCCPLLICSLSLATPGCMCDCHLAQGLLECVCILDACHTLLLRSRAVASQMLLALIIKSVMLGDRSSVSTTAG